MVIKGGILEKAGNANRQYKVGEEKEVIVIALNEWKIQKTISVNQTFRQFMESALSIRATVEGEDNGPLTVTMQETGNQYKVTDNEEITQIEKGLFIKAEGIPLEMVEGEEKPNGTLEAILTGGLKGNITWEIADSSIANINTTEGNVITVTANKVGETLVTARCNGYEATYTIKVIKKVELAVGVFIEYDVEYIDIYVNDYEYTSANGWRLIDYTENEDGTYSNVKIMSTGIPARFFYYNGNKTNTDWFVRDSNQLTEFRKILSGNDSYKFYSNNYYQGLGVAAGLYYNFGELKFAYGTGSRGQNLGWITSVTSNGETYNSENMEETTGEILFNLYGENAKVRILTLTELNTFLNNTDVDSTKAINDTTGLYKLSYLYRVLEGKNYSTGSWWLASPYPGSYDCHITRSKLCWYKFKTTKFKQFWCTTCSLYRKKC